MAGKQKLELTWIGKEDWPLLESRMLLEEPNKSYDAAHRASSDDIYGKVFARLPEPAPGILLVDGGW